MSEIKSESARGVGTEPRRARAAHMERSKNTQTKPQSGSAASLPPAPTARAPALDSPRPCAHAGCPRTGRRPIPGDHRGDVGDVDCRRGRPVRRLVGELTRDSRWLGPLCPFRTKSAGRLKNNFTTKLETQSNNHLITDQTSRSATTAEPTFPSKSLRVVSLEVGQGLRSPTPPLSPRTRGEFLFMVMESPCLLTRSQTFAEAPKT